MFKNKCNCWQWEIFETYCPFFVSLCCRLLTQVLINSFGSIIFLLQQLTKNLGQILAIIVLNLFREKVRVIIHIKVSSGCISRILFKDWLFSLWLIWKQVNLSCLNWKKSFTFHRGNFFKKKTNYFEEDANYLWVSSCLSLLSGSVLGDVTLFLFLCS